MLFIHASNEAVHIGPILLNNFFCMVLFSLSLMCLTKDVLTAATGGGSILLDRK
jgi:hypothetical protein